MKFDLYIDTDLPYFMIDLRQPPYFFRRHPWLFLAGLVLTTGLSIALAAELLLRLSGYLPCNQYLPFVEHLEVLPSFYTDEHGIFRANATFHWTNDVFINVDGFRSPPFSSLKKESSLSILLLGDSFVWGASASPLTRSFADLLRATGMLVHNTGIPGTGPTQYLAVAERFAPMLRPDVVVVVIFLGNDLFAKSDPLLPEKNLFYVTNAGWISGFDEAGNPLDVQQAYNHYIVAPRRCLQHLFYCTSLGTAFWKSAFNLKEVMARWWRRSQLMSSGRAVPVQEGSPVTALATPVNSMNSSRYPETRRCLLRIQAIAEAVGAQLFVLPIPSKGLFCKKMELSEVADLFYGFDLLPLDGITDAHYTAAPDCHLNNAGHLLIKDALLKTLCCQR